MQSSGELCTLSTWRGSARSHHHLTKPAGCSKRLLISLARPRRAETRLSTGKAAARSATRRIMSVTFADGRELVSAQCFRGEAYSLSPTRPRAAPAALARWYVEPLSDARTLLEDFFNSLLVEDQRRDRSAGRVSHREHRKGPAIPPCNPEIAKEISSR